MSKENAFCSDPTRTTPEPSQRAEATAGRISSAALTIDVVSDVICPWCYIGKRRLEKASSLLGSPTTVRYEGSMTDKLTADLTPLSQDSTHCDMAS